MIREKIIEETIRLFLKEGVDLKLSDICENISISKKTIYQYFANKESLLLEAVDFLFGQIKEEQKTILNYSISNIEKLVLLLKAMPKEYQLIDMNYIISLNNKYPRVYQKMNYYLETGWEDTFMLMDKCKEEGSLKKETNYEVFKLMYTSSIEKFISEHNCPLSFEQFQKNVVLILVGGIKNA
ncbi:MAG: TetR/AcrR family transcriptional regulator [Bacilli bacterium]|nr:TetR/AcrR family transcriptional regulator [Bacilli bacterium]